MISTAAIPILFALTGAGVTEFPRWLGSARQRSERPEPQPLTTISGNKFAPMSSGNFSTSIGMSQTIRPTKRHVDQEVTETTSTDHMIGAVRRMRLLAADWDGYGAAPLSNKVIQAAE